MAAPPTVALLPVDTENAQALIGHWLQQPHVRRWWGDDAGIAETVRTTAQDNHRLIVANTEAVGYLRWSVVDTAMLEALGIPGIPAGAVDADLFIGEANWLGRGVGPMALGELCALLNATLKPPLVGLCSSVDNRFAHRAFLKAGFSEHTVFDDAQYGRCVVFLRWL